MKKALLLTVILFASIISTACINNLAVQELNNKAKTYLENGDYENAISRLKSSIDLDSTIFETHYNLGIAYTQAEKYPEAVETLKNSIKLRPSFADAYYSLGVAQENYAKGIIDGSIKKTTPQDSSLDSINKVEESISKQKELSNEQKKQVLALLNDSINSYSQYLEKSQGAEDAADVQEKIEYLKTMSQKYSTDSQSVQ